MNKKCRFAKCNNETNSCAKPPYDNMCFSCYYDYMQMKREEILWRKKTNI